MYVYLHIYKLEQSERDAEAARRRGKNNRNGRDNPWCYFWPGFSSTRSSLMFPDFHRMFSTFFDFHVFVACQHLERNPRQQMKPWDHLGGTT